MSNKENIVQFLSKNNIKPNNLTLYRQALTHSSYNKFSKKNVNDKDYQTFEFLGDSILQFLVSNYLIKNYQDFDAGYLTLLRSNMVNTRNLNEISEFLNLKNLMLTAPGHMGGEVKKSPKVGADIFESFVAAIYLDQGLERANNFLSKYLYPSAEKFVKNKTLKDSKTTFQEYIQSFSKNAVYYQTINLSNSLFESKVIHDNNVYGKGQGKSKTEAEENAANDALKKLRMM
ncbi:ribonuclease III [Mycoplasmopsis columbina]|uniref:Ribonuclease 3 n=1 Tax=Mycoplasmopsis columbina SF7 TaxID=1037410 RepID=F9UJP2_9BACT|nr:ribonuclease III [Mycoplasmopsis columbina]EGV00423.1 ribonuclease III [Mycoplasmopsis columbina SF7]VEU76713.1 ribonuclease III (RNase III) [Mycoplasmopsis columbina]